MHAPCYNVRNLRAFTFCAGDYQSTFKGSQISCLTFPLPLLQHPFLKKLKGVKISSTRTNEPHCPGKCRGKTLVSWGLLADCSQAGSSSLVTWFCTRVTSYSNTETKTCWQPTTGRQAYFPNLLILHCCENQCAGVNVSPHVLGERMWFCNGLFCLSLCGAHLDLKEWELQGVRGTLRGQHWSSLLTQGSQSLQLLLINYEKCFTKCKLLACPWKWPWQLLVCQDWWKGSAGARTWRSWWLWMWVTKGSPCCSNARKTWNTNSHLKCAGVNICFVLQRNENENFRVFVFRGFFSEKIRE